MGSTTPNLSLYKPTVGETGWGDLVDANWDTLDSSGISPSSGTQSQILVRGASTYASITNWVFAEAYGASSGASAAANSTALQAALNAAAGYPVILPPGTCNYDTTLTLNQGQHVIGYGPIGYGGTNASVLNFTGGGTANGIERTTAMAWVRLEGFKVTDGRTSPTGGDGIHLDHVLNGTCIRNVGVAFSKSSASNAIYINHSENIDINVVWAFGGLYGIRLESYDNTCRVQSVYSDALTSGGSTQVAVVYINDVSTGQSTTVVENVKLETSNGCDVVRLDTNFAGKIRVGALNMRGPTQGLGGYVLNNLSANAYIDMDGLSSQPGFTTGPGVVALALVNDQGTLWYQPFNISQPRPRVAGRFTLQAGAAAPHTIVGGQAVKYRAVVNTNATLDSTDYALGVGCGPADRTVTLPPIAGDTSNAPAPGRVYKIRKTDYGVGQLLLAAASGETVDGGSRVAYDLFTDTDGTELTAHTPSGGGTWTEHSSYTSGDMIITDANRVRSNSSGADVVYHSVTPTNADYDVECDVYFASSSSDHVGVVGRVNTGADTYYGLRVTTSGGTLELFKVVTGTTTSLATWAAGYSSGTTHTIRLVMRGTTLTGYADGTLRVTATDSAISAAGKAGVRARGNTTNSTGSQIDNFAVYDPAVAYQAAATLVTGGVEILADQNTNRWIVTGKF